MDGLLSPPTWMKPCRFSAGLLRSNRRSFLQNRFFFNTQIRREAHRLGFSHVGIASADPPPPDDVFFRRWLAEGRHGEMSYLERQAPKRLDPRLVLPGVRSILVLSMNYYRQGIPFKWDPLKGRISRYAWGGEYHKVILGRLEALLLFIRGMEPTANGLCYVDTGPVLEKAWGARAGVGWIGKHTGLISRDLGSWFFLGVIFLDIPLEPDTPQRNLCGTCRRCIDACPTGAIISPYVLDAGICISYLTIEARGAISRRLCPLIGNRIFGCDDCQETCPWNRFARESSEDCFASEKEILMPDLIAMAEITDQEFRDWFKQSPIYRATRNGFVRNVVTALGNSGKAEAIPALEKALQDSSALVRASALWSLDRVSHKTALKIIKNICSDETDPLVLEEINFAFSRDSSGG